MATDPISNAPGGGSLPTIEALQQSIKNIILAARGSDPLRPSFGLGLETIIGAPESEIRAYIASELPRQITEYEPRLTLQKLASTFSDGALQIVVTCAPTLPISTPFQTIISVNGTT